MPSRHVIHIVAVAAWMAPAVTAAQNTPAPTPEQRYADGAAPTFPAAEYQARRAGLLAALAQAGGGVFLVPCADGVEDVLLVTDDGVEVLTRALPRSPEHLERMVR